MLGGPWGPRLTEENSEEREPLGVKCVRVYDCVCMCVRERGREGGQCYFNPELTSGCSTTPPCCSSLLTPQSIYLQSSCHCVVFTPPALLSSPLLSPSAVFFLHYPFSFFPLAAHRYTGVALPAPLRAGVLSEHFRMYCMLAVLFAHQVS